MATVQPNGKRRAWLGAQLEHAASVLGATGSRLRLRLLAAFGVDIDPAEVEWTCAHGDLHWANLTAPRLCLLDWRPGVWHRPVTTPLCCTAPAFSVQTSRIRGTFADLLDSPSGQVAQLAAIMKLLCLVEAGEHPDIAAPPHRHARTLVALRE